MRTKVTLVLLFLNVALFFFIFKFERNWRTEAESLEARRRVLGPEATNIRTLEVNRTTGGSFALRRERDEDWFLTAPLTWPANPHAVSSILNELQLLEHETSFRVADLAKTGQSIADYGLDKPTATVTFTSGDVTGASDARPPTVLRIGNVTADGKRLYLLSPDGQRVHVVGRTLLNALSYTVDQLRTDTLFTIPVFEARSLGVVLSAASDQDRAAAGAGLRTRIHRDGSRWTFDTPITARASKTAVDLAVNDLNALQPKALVPTNPSAASAAAPELRVTLEGNNRTQTLLLREPAGPAEGAAKAPPASIEYRGELEGRNVQFTVAVPVRLLEALRNAPEALRERRVLDEFDPATVTSITIAAPLLSTPALTLQRLDATTTEGTPQWQVVTRAAGRQAPAPVAADRPAIQQLLERLTLLKAETFKSEAPTSADLEEWGFNVPEREITLNFSNNRSPVVLRFGMDGKMPRNVYARVGTPADQGSSVYTVKVDPRTDFPMDVSAWRDRALRPPLPPRARFTNVKITDLDSRQVVFETGFDTEGKPTTPGRSPTAVPTLVNQLRNLHAKSILPIGFSDRVRLGHNERPWRYQLDATVMLPASNGTEAPETTTLLLTDRLGGAEQYAGSRDLDVIFAVEQPLLDAIWGLVARDPGPPAETKG